MTKHQKSDLRLSLRASPLSSSNREFISEMTYPFLRNILKNLTHRNGILPYGQHDGDLKLWAGDFPFMQTLNHEKVSL